MIKVKPTSDDSSKTPTPAPVASAPGGWMMSGAAAKAVADQNKEDMEKNSATSGAPWRFWMAVGSKRDVTFLDGPLDAQEYLDAPRYWEHNPLMNGSYKNFFPCLADGSPLQEPCPICEGGTCNPYLAGIFSIIDHTPYTSQKTGKVYVDRKMLYIVKPRTYDLLNEIAIKRGGLGGCRFDLMRPNKDDANVGSHFDFTVKNTIEELAAKWGDVTPFNYAEVMARVPGHELRKMGFGTQMVGTEAGVQEGQSLDGLKSQL